LRDPRVPETLLQSWSITPDPSANTSLRPTLSQLDLGICVPYLPQTYQHHGSTHGVPVTRDRACTGDRHRRARHARTRPLHTRADALTRQLPRAETQQLSEQSTGGWWAGHQGERQTCHCTGACERRGVVRTGILPDSSVGLPANPRSRAVILVGRGSQAGCGWAAPHRRRLLASCGAGACERRGVVRTGTLPDSSVGLPANPRRSDILCVSIDLW
jgi:hypothetical protein